MTQSVQLIVRWAVRTTPAIARTGIRLPDTLTVTAAPEVEGPDVNAWISDIRSSTHVGIGTEMGVVNREEEGLPVFDEGDRATLLDIVIVFGVPAHPHPIPDHLKLVNVAKDLCVFGVIDAMDAVPDSTANLANVSDADLAVLSPVVQG